MKDQSSDPAPEHADILDVDMEGRTFLISIIYYV